jgi:peptidoglycan hydrolase CwlO-like protein
MNKKLFSIVFMSFITVSIATASDKKTASDGLTIIFARSTDERYAAMNEEEKEKFDNLKTLFLSKHVTNQDLNETHGKVVDLAGEMTPEAFNKYEIKRRLQTNLKNDRTQQNLIEQITSYFFN